MQRMQIMLALLVAIISFPEAQGGALGMLYGIFGQQEYGSTIKFFRVCLDSHLDAVSNQALPSPTSQESTTNSARWAAAARDKKLSFGVDLQLKTRMEAASKYLSMLEEDEGSPCGHNTVMALLESGCHNLRDSTRMQIALKFANCHLHKAGLATYECDMVLEHAHLQKQHFSMSLRDCVPGWRHRCHLHTGRGKPSFCTSCLKAEACCLLQSDSLCLF
eukprot:jgi/Bigna1/82799/fgenesh1_pg.97_\